MRRIISQINDQRPLPFFGIFSNPKRIFTSCVLKPAVDQVPPIDRPDRAKHKGMIFTSLFPTKKYRSSKPKSLARKSFIPIWSQCQFNSRTIRDTYIPNLSLIVRYCTRGYSQYNTDNLPKVFFFLITAKIIYAAKKRSSASPASHIILIEVILCSDSFFRYTEGETPHHSCKDTREIGWFLKSQFNRYLIQFKISKHYILTGFPESSTE